jgi:two-component system chemotaxis response regulator CheY
MAEALSSLSRARVVSTELSPPIRLLPARAPHRVAKGKYSTRLLDRVSPFPLPSTRMTAQAPGILVVDDDEEVRGVVGEILTSEGYLVLPATNGAEALSLLERARVSLALLDMRMPVLDGWGFAKVLRTRSSRPPILIMSAAPNGQQWADDIGAAGCVAKPFDLLDLLSQVQRLVAPH